MTGGGGSSQTVNAQVILSDTMVSVATDDTATHALALQVYSDDYLPYEGIGYRDSIAADVSALPKWKAPKQGAFSLLITARPSGCATLMQHIELKKGLCDTITCRLGRCRDITGLVIPGDSGTYASAPSMRFALSVFGSPYAAVTDSSAGFTMKNMPSGRYTIRVRSLSKRIMISTVDYPVMIDSLFGNKYLIMMLP